MRVCFPTKSCGMLMRERRRCRVAKLVDSAGLQKISALGPLSVFVHHRASRFSRKITPTRHPGGGGGFRKPIPGEEFSKTKAYSPGPPNDRCSQFCESAANFKALVKNAIGSTLGL